MAQTPVLGVLRLDYSYPPNLGDVDHPGSFAYKTIYREIPGLTFTMCQSGKITAEVRDNCIEAVRYLNGQKVSGITGDCGFMINIEQLVRQYAERPVFLSSLDQLPVLMSAIGPKAEIGVFTANSETLGLIETRIDRLAGVVAHSPRIHIVGCQDIPGFEAVANGDKVDTGLVSKGIDRLARDFLDRNQKVKCLLLECTELGFFANELRRLSGLPVYDAITNCDAFMGGFMFDTRFGEQ